MKELWRHISQPATLEEALRLARDHGSGARFVAGGTDVVVELSRGVKETDTLIDLSRLDELRGIVDEGEAIRLGALSTHNDVLASADCVRHLLPLAQACAEIGAPQLRTRATIAGNIVTASPANDTLSALYALDASVVIRNMDRERVVPIEQFIRGFRQTDLAADELIVAITVPKLRLNQRGVYRKLGLRRAQAISVIHFAVVLTFDGNVVNESRIALGCVAPTVIRAPQAEAFLAGKALSGGVSTEASKFVASEARPIDDVRGSAAYRTSIVERSMAEALRTLATGRERDGWPEAPVLLDTGERSKPTSSFDGVITCSINGESHRLPEAAARKTLMNAMRDYAGLTGSKEGCAEGECGACTMWLDGQAVMSCLVPAVQAHGRAVTTIEGLGGGRPHRLQRAFVRTGAVQCGFCIPGMIMAGAKLLEERPLPDRAAIGTGLSGNLCRCTGYRKIVEAVELASTERD